jgi:hypothetical protein
MDGASRVVVGMGGPPAPLSVAKARQAAPMKINAENLRYKLVILLPSILN